MITSKNVEQFDYVQYTLPSLDMLTIAQKKEAIKILDEANKYLADTIGHYYRFYNEAVAWREKNKASIRDADLENIDENLKNLLTNISIVAGATVKITNATSDLSGKTQRTDIKSTTGNGKDNERDRTISQISQVLDSPDINNPEKVDQESVDKALEGISVAIDAIVVKVPTPTMPSSVNVPKTEEQRDFEQRKEYQTEKANAAQTLQKVLEAIKDNMDPTEIDLTSEEKKVALEAIESYLKEFDDEVDNDGLNQAAKTIENTKKGFEGLTDAIDATKTLEADAKRVIEITETDLADMQKEYEKEVERAKQEAQQAAAVADLNNIQTAIQQGTGSINTALDAINEAERQGLITPEDAEKQREAVVEKAATALGIDDEDKETMKNDIEKAAKELNDKINEINEKEEKGELSPEEAERERQKASEESKQKTESFVKDSITNSGSWGTGTYTKNPDGTTTWTSTDSAGNTITTTLDEHGNGTVTTTTTDGMTHTDTVTGGKKDNNTTHTPTKPGSDGSNTTTTTGGDGPGGDGPTSSGNNTE